MNARPRRRQPGSLSNTRRRLPATGGLLALGLAVLCWRPTPALPCTTFLMEREGVFIGKSYDWDTPYGLVMINKRGIAKRAMDNHQVY